VESVRRAGALLRSTGRVSLRLLGRELELDDAALADVVDELVSVQRTATREGDVLVAVGRPAVDRAPASSGLPGAGDAERRDVTVLFCDFVGSTELAARVDAEEFGESMLRFHETVTDVVGRFDGFVAQLLGDGLLVLFGYPEEHDDSAVQAVRAALAITEAVGDVVRIGLHTGPCLVRTIGAGGRQDTVVLGEAANIAARVQALAPSGVVCITLATAQLVSGWFHVASLGPHVLKGVPDPVEVLRVIAPTGARTRLEAASAAGLTPLVGRGAERQVLVENWRDVVGGAGRVVLIEGEPGIGKSRLARALREHLAGEDHAWLQGGCLDNRRNSAFHPIVEAVEGALDITSAHDTEERVSRVEQGLDAIGLGQTEPVALLTALLGLDHAAQDVLADVSPEARRRRTIDGVIQWVIRLSESRPVVVCVEDLHWCDPSSLELLGKLTSSIAGARVLVLGITRPESATTWEDLPDLTRVSLEPLGPEAASDLVAVITVSRHLASGNDRRIDDAVAQIVERGDGNPLFLEELTRDALEIASADPSASADHYVPVSLNSLLLGRLDRLGDAKTIAQVAAVIGREFSAEMLRMVIAAGADQAADDVHEAIARGLDRLEASGLATPVADRPSTYVFKHALVHDIAYQSLLRVTRRALHGRVVAAMRNEDPEHLEAHPEVVAYHADAGGLSDEAIVLYAAAAKNAATRSAWAEAIGHLRSALDVLERDPATDPNGAADVAVRQSMAVTMIRAQGYAHPETIAAWEAVRAASIAADDEAGLLAALLGLGTGHYVAAEFGPAGAFIDEALELADRTSANAITVACHTVKGSIAFFRGRFEESFDHLERAIALYDPAVHHEPLVSILADDSGVTAWATSGWVKHWMGEMDEGLRRADKAIEMVSTLRDPYSDVQARLWRLVLLGERVDPRSEAAAEEVLKLTEEQDLPAFGGGVRMCLGRARHDLDEINAGAAMAATTGTMLMAPALFMSLAVAHRARGESAEAIAMLDVGLDLAGSTEQTYILPILLAEKAAVLLEADPAPSGDAMVDIELLACDALDLAAGQGSTIHQLRAAIVLSRVRIMQDRDEDARQILASRLAQVPACARDTIDLLNAAAVLAQLDASGCAS
jgi:class 3 adenylate cyclase/tetratricopeptide (TPR) repeat protein